MIFTSCVQMNASSSSHLQKVVVSSFSMLHVALNSVGTGNVCLARSFAKCSERFLFFSWSRRETTSSDMRLRTVVGNPKRVKFLGSC